MAKKNINILCKDLSGWLTAIYLLYNTDAKITLIEDGFYSNGEVESIHPSVVEFLNQSGLDLDDWMPRSSATFRYGIMFDLWEWNPISEEIHLRMIDTERDFVFGKTKDGKKLSIVDAMFSNACPYEALREWIPSRQLSLNCISPVRGVDRLDYHGDIIDPPYVHGVHWECKKLYEVLKEKCLSYSNFKYLQNQKIVEVNLTKNGDVEKITTAVGLRISGDFWFDGTGELLDKTYELKWKPYDFFFNNSVMTIRKQYSKPKTQCRPYSKNVVCANGSTMIMPTYDNIVYQYYYGRADKEVIEKELRNFSRVHNAEVSHATFDCGVREKAIHKNVCGIGSVPGYVDPALGTNHILTTILVRDVIEECDSINKNFQSIIEEMSTFVSMHYQMECKQPTGYWKAVKKIPLPIKQKRVRDIIKKNPITLEQLDDIFEHPTERIFLPYQWFEFMFGFDIDDLNAYYHEPGLRDESASQKRQAPYDYDDTSYTTMILEKYVFNTRKIIETFPNHWWYLDCWYNGHPIVWPTATGEQTIGADTGSGGFMKPPEGIPENTIR